MTKLKIVNQDELKDWAKEIFKKNSFNMVDVSSKKETFRRALASGKIYVGKEVFDLIKNKKMPKGDPVTLALERNDKDEWIWIGTVMKGVDFREQNFEKRDSIQSCKVRNFFHIDTT